MPAKTYKSAEDYLETILILEKRQGQPRSIDVAGEMGFSKPSVSHAMKLLRERGQISVDESGLIHLSAQGRAIAERIYERHQLLSNMLIALGVDAETAYADACKIEHDVSEKSFEMIKKHYRHHLDGDQT
ncbi:MAG: metal-dependent transcriptional regulator [Christensenellaceae bacterium]|jgi:Mn-dependent DtxR family transcriptional regulator|nr:metal-dependent transcriptional regulator [Christensenellaceae bacterium]